jgi:hypothetical protein
MKLAILSAILSAIVFGLLSAPLRAAPAVSDTGSLSPIQSALKQLASDATAYEQTSGSLIAAQKAVSVLMPATSAAQAAIAADQAALAALTGGTINPGPGPTPGPVTHVVSILAVTATGTWCGPCTLLKNSGVFANLQAAGAPITVIAAENVQGWQKYGPLSFPTMIVLLDGVEPASGTKPAQTRIVGWPQTPAVDPVAWYKSAVQWANGIPPNPPTPTQ